MPLNSQNAARAREREQNRARKPPSQRQARPIAEGVIDRGCRYSITQRTQCLALLSIGLSSNIVTAVWDPSSDSAKHHAESERAWI